MNEKTKQSTESTRKVKLKTNAGNPIITQCKIHIGEVGWFGKDTQICEKEEDAMIINGKARTKSLVKFLKKQGVHKVSIKEIEVLSV